MKQSTLTIAIGAIALFMNTAFAAPLTEQAELRGVSPKCVAYLNAIEEGLNLNGLTNTMIPSNPDTLLSLYIAAKKEANETSFHSITLSPDGEMCDVSLTFVTMFSNQSCEDIVQSQLAINPTLRVDRYGVYTHVYPEAKDSNQVLVSTGEASCAVMKTQLLFPER